MKFTQISRAGLATAVVGSALLAAGAATAGIVDTRHNLSSTSTIGAEVSDTDQVCAFCHTPHGADTNVTGAPLWNKNLSSTTYTLYSGPGSMDSTTATGGIGATSRVCLSCHDGTQAMDNILNAPGSGGLTTGGGASGLAYNWTTTGSNGVDTDGFLTTANAARLGTDLSNDHPIAIQYCGGGLTGDTTTALTVVTANCADTDFRNPDTSVLSGNRRVWWVESLNSTGAGRSKSDVQLYTRNQSEFGAGTALVPTIECASCHEVHGGGATTDLFLRVNQAQSTLCRTCHTK